MVWWNVVDRHTLRMDIFSRAVAGPFLFDKMKRVGRAVFQRIDGYGFALLFV